MSLRKVTSYFASDPNLFTLLPILFLTFIARLPSLFEPFWYGDEGIYYFVSNGINHGLSLYKDVYEISLPVKYYLLSILIKIFGLSLWSGRFFLSYWVTFTQIGIYLLGKKLFNAKVGLIGAIFYGLLTTTPYLEGNIFNNEILMVLPVILGMIAYLNKNYIWTGILFSLGFLIKVPAIFDLFALCFFIFWSERFGGIKKLFTITFWFSLPFVVVCLFYLVTNNFGYFFQANFARNVGYASFANTHFFKYDLLILRILVILGFCLLLLYKKKLIEKTLGWQTILIITWFVFASFATTLSGRGYVHYLIQTLPPLSLILANLIFNKTTRRYLVSVVLSILIFIYLSGFKDLGRTNTSLLYYYPNFFKYLVGSLSQSQYNDTFDKKVNRDYLLAQIIKEKSSPKDKIFIWSDRSMIYPLANRLGATRFGAAYHIWESKSFESEAISILQKTPPELIVVEENYQRELPGLENLLGLKYNRIGVIEDAVIFKRI